MASERDYPTQDELDKIVKWPPPDWKGLFEFVHSIWWMADWGVDCDGDNYSFSTGGWSGNEDLIGAMQQNFIFWSLCWVSSKRGGHFEFKLPDTSIE